MNRASARIQHLLGLRTLNYEVRELAVVILDLPQLLVKI